jgi:hypothetical protein
MLRCLFSLVLIVTVAFEGIPAAARSAKPMDALRARVRVQKLGVGEHVMVKTARGQELHGHIIKIDSQAFTLKPDHSQQTEIAYADVTKIRKNPGPVLWIVVGAVLVIIIIAAAK